MQEHQGNDGEQQGSKAEQQCKKNTKNSNYN
jgi:hypothetical protein